VDLVSAQEEFQEAASADLTAVDVDAHDNLADARKELREAISAHLVAVGVGASADSPLQPPVLPKQTVRAMHCEARRDGLRKDADFIRRRIDLLESALVDGRRLDAEAIEPVLVEVMPGTQESELFRLATKLWSVPVSSGFGRRIRFLVWDRHHDGLIGVFAVGDPVFNLSSRDKWIGWNVEDRRERLVHVMDAFVVGALPPYSQLIGGKLVASLAASDDVRRVYDRKYCGRMSVIRQVERRAPLALLTTTSALGRSSLYNRLRVPDGPEFLHLGATKGYGHFHFSDRVFQMMRAYLGEMGHPYASGNRFGDGPNWRLRVARVALREVGLDERAVLNHGVPREVYAAPLASNWRQVLLGEQADTDCFAWPSDVVAESCLKRWVVPRASRDESYRAFRPNVVCERLLEDVEDAQASRD